MSRTFDQKQRELWRNSATRKKRREKRLSVRGLVATINQFLFLLAGQYITLLTPNVHSFLRHSSYCVITFPRTRSLIDRFSLLYRWRQAPLTTDVSTFSRLLDIRLRHAHFSRFFITEEHIRTHTDTVIIFPSRFRNDSSSVPLPPF